MPDVEELARESTVVFRGRVERLPGSTLASLPPSDETAVVRVDEVIRAPEGVPRLGGRDVTVRLREPGSLQEGAVAVFFTVSWLFGEGIAVHEVGHERLEPDEATPSHLTEAVRARAELEETGRIAQAQAVVAGRVADVRPSTVTTDAPGVRPPSEHDPQWHEAEIEIEEVVKGDVPEARTVVLFPASTDVMWYRAPKLTPGQQGVWVLHDEQIPESVASAFPSVFTALDPTDVRPREELEHVRELVDRSNR